MKNIVPASCDKPILWPSLNILSWAKYWAWVASLIPLPKMLWTLHAFKTSHCGRIWVLKHPRKNKHVSSPLLYQALIEHWKIVIEHAPLHENTLLMENGHTIFDQLSAHLQLHGRKKNFCKLLRHQICQLLFWKHYDVFFPPATMCLVQSEIDTTAGGLSKQITNT